MSGKRSQPPGLIAGKKEPAGGAREEGDELEEPLGVSSNPEDAS